MKKYSRGILQDFARLASHGPDEIESLIADLSNPARREILIQLLRQISEASSEPENVRPKSAPSSSFTYADVKIPEPAKSNPDRREKLEAIFKALTTTAYLQSRPVLVSLAERLDVPLAKKDSRARVVQKIIDTLAICDSDQLTHAMLEVRKADRGSTESFMDLASFITNGPRKGVR